MRKLIVLQFMSLDGVVQAPGGPEEDTSDGFKYGGWSFPFWDESSNRVMGEQMGHPFDLLLGRKTYDIFAGYWPNQKQPPAEQFNKATKYVASRTLKYPTWENTVVLSTDVAQEVKKLKQTDGLELQVHGSGDFIQTLLQNDLVDEMWLKIFPLTLGKGKRLFGSGAIPAGFKLIYSEVTPSGVIIANYKREGDIKVGSFAAEQ